MSEAYIGEIRCFGFALPPDGWALCDGKVLPIAQNQALFAALGDTFGGDGRTTFALPDLRGRAGVGQGPLPQDATNYTVGETGGAEGVTLTPRQVPTHSHPLVASDAVATKGPGVGNYLARPVISAATPTGQFLYSKDIQVSNLVALDPTAVSSVGGVAHDNMQPYQVLMFAIATRGVWPTNPNTD